MNTQSLQSLAQLQALQSMSSSGTSAANTSNSTSDLFAQMLSQLTNSPSSTSDTTQMLGLTNSLSSSNSSSYLSQLLSSYSPLSSLLGNASSTDYSQLQTGLGSSATTDYSQLLNGLSNSVSNTNNSLFYKGTSPVYTPVSVLNKINNNYDQALSNLTNQQAGSTSVSSNTNYDAFIKKASQTFGIPEKMIKSVIKQESGFKNNATSSAGAGGLMQLMPGTAKYLGVSNVYDAEQNIMGGTKYLKQLYDKFGGNYQLMLAAYNAGPGAVTKYGGIPPYKETTNYVNNIMNTYKA
ncbi:lytic transglycosylase domain-containing protein [Rummeliibacillus pycnus]|uniref:lytic transglycosylase domain-containing protein n=1 Tax=Rummeliibacillus pycnus TaxID=101070 RepID=UPI0037C4F0EB